MSAVQRQHGAAQPVRVLCNLGKSLRGLVLPPQMAHWSLTALREKLVRIGARLPRHARRLIPQMEEAAIPRELFGQILSRIRRLTPVPT